MKRAYITPQTQHYMLTQSTLLCASGDHEPRVGGFTISGGDYGIGESEIL